MTSRGQGEKLVTADEVLLKSSLQQKPHRFSEQNCLQVTKTRLKRFLQRLNSKNLFSIFPLC